MNIKINTYVYTKYICHSVSSEYFTRIRQSEKWSNVYINNIFVNRPKHTNALWSGFSNIQVCRNIRETSNQPTLIGFTRQQSKTFVDIFTKPSDEFIRFIWNVRMMSTYCIQFGCYFVVRFAEYCTLTITLKLIKSI